MPYANVADLPPAVRSKLSPKKQRQWLHVWNSSYDRHSDESRAFAEAWASVRKAAKQPKSEVAYQTYPRGQKKCGTCTMFRRPAACTAVSGEILARGWCKLYDPIESDKLGKADVMSDFSFFLPIAKVDKEKRTVSGYASTGSEDSDGEIIRLEAVRDALPNYMLYGNIREMHALKAVGVAKEANMDNRGLFLTAKIVDDQAWKKCLEGVYKGFSIGGRKLKKAGNEITKLELNEISVVDRPANPDCNFTVAKSAKALADEAGYLVKLVKKTPEQRALAKMAKVVQDLTKAGPPAAHDGFSLPAKPVAAKKAEENPSPKDNSEQNNKSADSPWRCEEHDREDCEECMDKREFSSKERQSAADSGAALPDGSFPIKTIKDLENAVQAFGRAKDKAKAKAHIKSRARALGATDKLPDSWSKAKVKKSAAIEFPTFLELRKYNKKPSVALTKSMSSAGQLAYCFDSIRSAQRSLMLEGQREGGDKKDQQLAKQLGNIAKTLAEVIGQKAAHEGEEATTLTDADDQYVTSILGDNDTMKTNTNGSTIVGGVDPLAVALMKMAKAAQQPTREALMDEAKKTMGKARKAMKECRKAIEEAHKMHKAAFIAKAAKAKGKGDDDEDDKEFDHTGAMEKLSKAYEAADKARTFGKAAEAKLTKAESAPSRAGQRGQEAGDAEPGFYTVPAGVTDLSPRDMATAGPGTQAKGGMPPAYPGDGSVYAGKAVGDNNDLRKYADKNGNVPANVAELMMKNAKAEAELETLRRIPVAPAGGRRPYSFDPNTLVAGNTRPQDLNKALFDGVNVEAINGQDERAHTEASAKVIGNFLTSGQFGKSVWDPSFKGAAGNARG